MLFVRTCNRLELQDRLQFNEVAIVVRRPCSYTLEVYFTDMNRQLDYMLDGPRYLNYLASHMLLPNNYLQGSNKHNSQALFLNILVYKPFHYYNCLSVYKS